MSETLELVYAELIALRAYHERRGWLSTITAQHVMRAIRLIEAARQQEGE